MFQNLPDLVKARIWDYVEPHYNQAIHKRRMKSTFRDLTQYYHKFDKPAVLDDDQIKQLYEWVDMETCRLHIVDGVIVGIYTPQAYRLWSEDYTYTMNLGIDYDLSVLVEIPLWKIHREYDFSEWW